MRTLIFDHVLSGHHLEYINYIYKGAHLLLDEEFVFAVPKKELEKYHAKCDWPEANNVRWVMLDDSECKKASEGSMMAQCYRLSKLIKKIAVKEKVDKIKLISLAGVIPFLPLMLPNNIKLSGIIYRIYLRSPKKGFRALLDRCRYTIMANNKSMDKVFILNDPRSTKSLNKIFNSENFIVLADPVPIVERELHDLRRELNIPKDSIVYLHFGTMDERKGTLEILRSLDLMTPQELSERTFIFAGRININIKDQFYSSVEKIRSRGAIIIVKDEFCSYELLHSLCHTCNYILIPYLLTNLSSGVLGYAALHGKSVIGPKTGLIGELIADNNLGINIDVSPESLRNAILKPEKCSSESGGHEYIVRNTRERFVEQFLA